MSAPSDLPPTPTRVDDKQVTPKGRRRLSRRTWIGIAFAATLLVGVGIGTTANGNATQLDTASKKLALAHKQIATLQSENSTLQSKYATAKNTAQNALEVANTKAQRAYASRQSALNQRAASLNQRARKIAAEEGNLQANTISTDGVYVVGHDIKAGTWHTNGDGGQTDNECYFATLNSSNTSDINDNNNFDGPETVNVSGVYAFQISGPCTWVRQG
ncbi:MAG TPA: hypothetical protein VGJ50_18040 [Streptosporangiaceae bacterium]|jgi:carboxypeptidase C (cathepsin A)